MLAVPAWHLFSPPDFSTLVMGRSWHSPASHITLLPPMLRKPPSC